MNHFKSGLARHFRPDAAPRPLTEPESADLARATRCLVVPCIQSTVFAIGALDLAVVKDGTLYTIFSRRNRGQVPYALVDLATDLVHGVVDRSTISFEVETSIREIARLGPSCLTEPIPVLVEAEAQCLILEGNKRFTAMAIGPCPPDAVFRAWVGRSTLAWEQLLACYAMRPTSSGGPPTNGLGCG